MGGDERELIRRWRQGDAAAFAALVRRWQAPLGRLLCRLVGSAEAAGDLSQEVFLRLWQARDRYRETGAFHAWLYQIALNVARDAARRQVRRPEQLVPVPDTADPWPSPPVATADREAAAAVTEAVALLPHPLREALVLRHYEGLRFEDMARMLRTPSSTLKSRFAAALDRVRLHLEHRGFGPEEDGTP
jgi:RNA polymerase sigma-70 factor (ECF subfamily)